MAKVTFKGNPVTLLGGEVSVGAEAPAFKVVNNALQPVTHESLKDKVTVISVVPSLDTPVCEIQTKKFNEEIAKISGPVQLYTVSLDLPFAQKRFCAANKTDKVVALSDYQDRSFGPAWGVQMKDSIKLLTRSIFVTDKKGVVRHAEYVAEVTKEPDYEAALKAVKAAL